LAKIAVALERAVARRALEGAPGRTVMRRIACGDGWSVGDVICTYGPGDRPFEERRPEVAIAIVTAGSFQYRSGAGRELMTPGSVMLGDAGRSFECGHEHGAGDRCLSFHYDPDHFDDLVADVTGRPRVRPSGVGPRRFGSLRLPPLRALSALVARACAGLIGAPDVSWEELSVEAAARTVQLAGGFAPVAAAAPPSAIARVTRVVRRIECDSGGDLSLRVLAREARLSPYHFLRAFQRLTGVTPHQFVLRTRLRDAALRLAAQSGKVADIAFDSGFGDVSNFNRAFRSEFGASPRAYRRREGTRRGGWRGFRPGMPACAAAR
jgi:AraC-like DNA-binding protein